MTLQLLHSEFPYIWGKFDFLFISAALRYFLIPIYSSTDFCYITVDPETRASEIGFKFSSNIYSQNTYERRQKRRLLGRNSACFARNSVSFRSLEKCFQVKFHVRMSNFARFYPGFVKSAQLRVIFFRSRKWHFLGSMEFREIDY